MGDTLVRGVSVNSSQTVMSSFLFLVCPGSQFVTLKIQIQRATAET